MNTKKEALFKEKLKLLYPIGFKEIIESISQPLLQSFRITNKAKEQNIIDSIKKQGFQLEETLLPSTYKVLKLASVAKTPEFANGDMYIQNLSSMLPALLAQIKQNEKVLDLCAAPGSKTELITHFTSDENIYAVEKQKSRYFKLKQNLQKYNHPNVHVFNLDGKQFPFKKSELQNSFDKVIVDVPCSGEGMIYLCDEKSIESWNPKQAKQISKLQKGLLSAGFKMVRPGGTLVYSTCTFSVEENEAVVDWFLRRDIVAEIQDIKVTLNKYNKNFISGFTSYKNKSFHKDINKTIRIIPDGKYMGFYVAVIRKVQVEKI